MSHLKVKAIRAKYEAEKAAAVAELDFWMNSPSDGKFMEAIEDNLKKLSNANQMISIIDAAFTVSKPGPVPNSVESAPNDIPL